MAMKRLLQSTLFKRAHFLGREHVELCQYHDNETYKGVKALGIVSLPCLHHIRALHYMCDNLLLHVWKSAHRE